MPICSRFVKFVDDTDICMSDLVDTISTLDKLVEDLLQKVAELQARNGELVEELRVRCGELEAGRQKLRESEEQLSALRIANGLVGGENKAETKLKINTLIRDLDHCIAQLSE